MPNDQTHQMSSPEGITDKVPTPASDQPPALDGHAPAQPSNNAPPPTSSELPPAYCQDTAGGPDEIIPPAALVIHGRFIYPLSPSGEPSSDPLYQLSRAIHAVGHATEDMTIERLEYRVRTNTADGSPAVAHRARDLYQLTHHLGLPFMGVSFEAKLTPTSNKTLGRIVITKSPPFKHGYRALKVLPEDEKLWRERKGMKVDEGEYHFVIKAEGDKGWKWIDSDGRTVAKQEREKKKGVDEEDEFRLRVLVSLPRRTLDSLVSLWCLWMWHIRIEENKPKKTWEDRKRILQGPRVLSKGFFYQ
ncbi:hypothetical protein VTI74DRAFT_11251 [Chaetomium olivicolor]